MSNKVCTVCNTPKEEKEFNWGSPSVRGKLSRQGICKNCASINTKLRTYNLTLEEYTKMQGEHNGICGLCGKKSKQLVIDHDHKTGKVRKLLCSACNSGLGMFKDDVRLLEKAIEYLNFYKDTEHE